MEYSQKSIPELILENAQLRAENNKLKGCIQKGCNHLRKFSDSKDLFIIMRSGQFIHFTQAEGWRREMEQLPELEMMQEEEGKKEAKNVLQKLFSLQ